MTDGIQTVVGIEWKPIKALKVHAPRGLKVAISTVKLRDGCFLLAPENIRVLGGGLVEQLDEAQNPVVDELSEPSRGKRVDDPSHCGSTLHSTDTVQASNQGKSDDHITEGCNKTSGLVVCFGEMLDFVPLVGEVSLDEASAFEKAPGGAPANVAVGISKLGGSSAFISKVGEDDNGYMLADILKQNNVDTSGMRFDRNARTALAFVTLTADGERKYLFLRNPSADMLLDKSKLFLFFQNPTADMLLDESEVDHNLIKKAKIFHFGSISLIDEPCKSAHLAALEIAKASDCILSYDPNLRLSLWPSAKAARDGIMSIWDEANVIKISKDEITFLTGGDSPYDVVINKLFHPKLKLLIVTEGSEGCRYYTKDFKGKVRGVNVQTVDTTGAGDAFVSGILYHIASDPSIFEDEVRLRKALYFANVCGAITVRERDAIPALPTKDAVLQFDATLEHKLL